MKREDTLKNIRVVLILLCASFTSQAYGQNTFILQPNSTQGKDAIITSLSPSQNYGNHPDFMATAWTNGGTSFTSRSLLEFDLSNIPQTAAVMSAYLTLYSYDSPLNGTHSTLSGSNEATLQRITQSWTEGNATWDNQPTTTTQNQVSLEESSSSIQHYYNIDVTTLVQDMIDNPSGSHGFLFSLVNESYYRQMLFASSDNSDSECTLG